MASEIDSVGEFIDSGRDGETVHSAADAAKPQRSCQICNQRKIRCDRKAPCTPCSKARRACVYPQKTRGTRRPYRTLRGEMAARLASLEERFAAGADEAGESRPSRSQPSARTEKQTKGVGPERAVPLRSPGSSSSVGQESRGDGLLGDRSASQYHSDVVFSRIVKDNEHIQTALATPQSTDISSRISDCYSPLGIISAPDRQRPPHIFHPSSDVAMRLWQRYVDTIEDGNGVKMLHIPTDEVRVFSTIHNPANAAFDDLALCFAIYFGAAGAMDEDEATLTLKEDIVEGITRLKHGFEQALAHAAFLEAPTFTALKAFAVYTATLRVRYRGKALWMINGLALRAAWVLGLHNDGEALGLSPFESEMRRRVWWFLNTSDGRSKDDNGISGTPAIDQSSAAVAFPLNIADMDIHPDMKELPPPRKGFTPMSLSLVGVEIYRTLERLKAGLATHDLDESVRAQAIDGMKEAVHIYLEGCNPVIPKQRRLMLVAEMVTRRLDLVSRIEWELLRNPEDSSALLKEENLSEAVEILDLVRSMYKDELLAPYLISCRAYPQHSLMLYVLWSVCTQPEEPISQRAWEVVEETISLEFKHHVHSLGPKEVVLNAMVSKAKVAMQTCAGVLAEDIEMARPMDNFQLEPMDELAWMSFIPRLQEGDTYQNDLWG